MSVGCSSRRASAIRRKFDISRICPHTVNVITQMLEPLGDIADPRAREALTARVEYADPEVRKTVILSRLKDA
jgi:hypothetical protein